jgi:hypothetical protein
METKRVRHERTSLIHPKVMEDDLGECVLSILNNLNTKEDYKGRYHNPYMVLTHVGFTNMEAFRRTAMHGYSSIFSNKAFVIYYLKKRKFLGGNLPFCIRPFHIMLGLVTVPTIAFTSARELVIPEIRYYTSNIDTEAVFAEHIVEFANLYHIQDIVGVVGSPNQED